MYKVTVLILVLVFMAPAIATTSADDTLEIETRGHYRMQTGDTVKMARALALFNARKKAVDSAVVYFCARGLIKAYALKKAEIFSLTARVVAVEILSETRTSADSVSEYRVRVRVRVRPSDFIRAEILDKKREAKDASVSLRQELEPAILPGYDPGLEIARAYRLIRENRLRMAIIYLDRLQLKYPNWSTVYMAKAICYYALHEPLNMQKSLLEACKLENQRACDDLSMLKKVNSVELDSSTGSVKEK